MQEIRQFGLSFAKPMDFLGGVKNLQEHLRVSRVQWVSVLVSE